MLKEDDKTKKGEQLLSLTAISLGNLI